MNPIFLLNSVIYNIVMKRYLHLIIIALISILTSFYVSSREISYTDRAVVRDGKLQVDIKFDLDTLKLGANRQIYLSPVLIDGKGNKEVLPALLVNGRNMHYAYERKTIKKGGTNNYSIYKEVRRLNGQPQSVDYSTSVPLEAWMRQQGTKIVLVQDTCGCGHEFGSRTVDLFPINLIPNTYLAYKTPEVTPLPIANHEGRARVQFEVDRTELHDQPYKCRNGQIIDNRAQLQVIIDSINYAVSDPNVEIASIKIVGYASPESPYLHNEELSTGRSRALAEYIANRYNLPKEQCTFDAVAENWKEFRAKVLMTKEITESQRRDLLELIDRPCYGPSDYDAKEKELKTSKKYADLYKSLILPKWFPELRATEFSINTRLKPASDEKLAEIIEITPQLMSLNQMMRVARLYEEGSDEFNRVIDIALKYYPEDETANLNAAVSRLKSGNLEEADKLLVNSGNSPEAENARGVVAVRKGENTEARKHFENAGNLPEAKKNIVSLGEE